MKKIKFSDIIIFEDEDYVLVNKPAHVATLADRNDKINISDMAKAYTDDAQVCHRLDKDTSGVLAIAKNPEAYRHLSIQFERREVKKEYHAVVDGIHQFQNTVVNEPLVTKGNGQVRINKSDGKESITSFDTAKAFRNHSLINCKPTTGRMHQIRVHLSHLGAPITGDALYGGKMFYLSSLKKNYRLKKWTDEQPLIRRFALHAHALEFKLINGAQVKIEAPYPKDMRVLVAQLEKNL
jgi:23S rRNA pseudouridine955/2504/2580 synthase